MQADDDLEIILLAAGWHRLPEHTIWDYVNCGIREREWLAHNCVHDHKVMYGRILFEKEEDALAFKLTCL